MRAQTAPGVFQHRYGVPRDFNHGDGPSLRDLMGGHWKPDGRCVGTDGEAWFAEPSTRTARDAASVCATCPVREACLASALVFDEEFGVWGGLDAHERQPLSRRLAAGEPIDAVLSSAFGVAGGEAA